MTKTDRAEVREMLHDILAGHQAKSESAIDKIKRTSAIQIYS